MKALFLISKTASRRQKELLPKAKFLIKDLFLILKTASRRQKEVAAVAGGQVALHPSNKESGLSTIPSEQGYMNMPQHRGYNFEMAHVCETYLHKFTKGLLAIAKLKPLLLFISLNIIALESI